MIDVKAIRERADKATPGPWTDGHYLGGAGEVFSLDSRGDRKVHVADCFTGPWNKDADFIAHARDDIPALLDALAAANARADAAEAEIAAAQAKSKRLVTYALALRQLHNEHPMPVIETNVGYSLSLDAQKFVARAYDLVNNPRNLQPGDLGDGA